MSDLASFFLASKASVILYETLEISHSSFSKVYRIVRNNRLGVSLYVDNALVFFEYYPLKITRLNSSANLDQSLKITVGDLGGIIREELTRVALDDSFSEKPRVVFRAYRSDNPKTPTIGAIDLEMASVNLTREGAAFEAKPPALNASGTGEIYTLARFQGLRGFL